ncbi:BofC C-terminal domain-containing protein [Brevibacterium sp. JNUCC-42]|nr:BofC C-terminal domain-containing protein [Brevibacterium sp. JNUCC-42]
MFKLLRPARLKWKWLMLFLMLTVGLVLGFWASRLEMKLANQEGRNSMTSQFKGEESVPVFSMPRQVVLTRTYVCGVTGEEKKEVRENTLDQILKPYAGWELVSVHPDHIVLHKEENDLAPICKENGYFGLSPDGFLTFFDGLPDYQKVIQTFYQINTDSMKASLSKEEIGHLYKGIRVRDLAEYNSILSTFSEFQRQIESH